MMPRPATIAKCSRCGRAHTDLAARKFVQAGILDFTHWAMCPVYNEPLLVKFVEVVADAAAAVDELLTSAPPAS